jgi:hypothetical protein
MPKWFSTLLPRAAALVLVALGATATLTYAAGRNITSDPPSATPAATAATVVVPDVQNQAFVFAKGALEDAGFAWRVSGSVRGYAVNTVVSQSPAGGTKLLDTGAPLITVRLKRNSGYKQVGQAQDVAPYASTAVQPVGLYNQPLGPVKSAAAAKTKKKKQAATAKKQAAAAKPATAATKTTAAPATVPAKTTTAPATAPATTTTAPATAAKPEQRPVAFLLPGAQKEPLDEMPLPKRAKALERWLAAHPKPTDANVKHWLYQNEWIVAGAKFGWWHGAEALRTLIAVDKQTNSAWGVGAKSATAATAALGFVVARSKS